MMKTWRVIGKKKKYVRVGKEGEEYVNGKCLYVKGYVRGKGLKGPLS